ncbi:MAG: TIGR02444 family protein [Pseudomonadales bacterium]
MSEANPLWRYSLEFYARPGAESALLYLQDVLKLDVNLLLLCCWGGEEGLQLNREFLTKLLSNSELQKWHAEGIVPLRQLRRAIKGFDLLGAQQVREQIKQAEIAAEEVQQDHMYHLLKSHIMPAAPGPYTLYQNLSDYGQLQLSRALEWHEIKNLFVVAFPDMTESQLQEDIAGHTC